jgi:hypothetical protein
MDVHVAAQDGHFISEKHARISEIIQDFNPELRLAWIPPENRVDQELTPPFAVIHEPRDRVPYIVFTIKEDELDERVLQKLILGDLNKVDVLAELEAGEKAYQLMNLKEKMEKAEDRQDFIKTVVGSNKHSFRHNGRIIPT